MGLGSGLDKRFSISHLCRRSIGILATLVLVDSAFRPQVLASSPSGELCRAFLAGEPQTSRTDKLSKVYGFFERDQSQRVKFLNGDYQGYSVVLLRQLNIKALLESQLGTAGTDRFLSEFYVVLHEHTQSFGVETHLLHSNFKQHYFVTKLSEEQFWKQIVLPTIDEVSRRLGTSSTGLNEGRSWSAESWRSWQINNLRLGVGMDLPSAAFRLNQILRSELVPMAYGTWQSAATDRRTRLKKAVQAAGVSWELFLEHLHRKLGRGQDKQIEFSQWLSDVGLARWSLEARRYLSDLNMGDHFNFDFSQSGPMPLPQLLLTKRSAQTTVRSTDQKAAPELDWMVEKNLTIELSRSARYVFVLDVEKLGVEARKIQDQWIARGAPQNELFRLYSEIELEFQSLIQAVRNLFQISNLEGREDVRPLYVSKSGGDEITVYFGELDASAKQRVERRLRDLSTRRLRISTWNLHVSELIGVATTDRDRSNQEENVATAVALAQKSMDQAKLTDGELPVRLLSRPKLAK